MLVYSKAFLLVLTLISPLYALADESGYTVCTATVNSPEERESFKQHLSGQNFNFVELTDYSEAKSKDDRGSDWFRKACEAGVKCDVLVISGHFGGNFFGDSGFSLQTDLMEEQSCQNTCSGILNQPKEVFLFGCNTLATKEKDHRSPQEYLRVLIEDGIERDDAERIVQARYGALGDSYKDRMRRIFSGVKHIYGFDSVGPSGKTVKPFLDRYFKRMPDYQNHLLKMDAENLVALIDKANRAVKAINNTVLGDVLSGTAFAQCSGITEEDPAYHLKKEICQLYDLNLSNADKIKAIDSMLKSENSLLYLPSISAFLKENHYSILEDAEAKKALQKIASDPEIKEEIDTLLRSLEGSPALQIDIMHLKWVFGWTTKEQFEANVKLLLKDTFKNLNRESADLLCSLQENDLLQLNVTYEDFNPSQLRTSIGAAVFTCLKTDDQRITREVLKSFDQPNREYLPGMLWAATNLPGHEDEFRQIANRYMNSKIPWASEASRRLLLYKGTPEEQRQQVRALINEEQGIWMAAQFIQESKFKDDSVGRAVLQKLQKNPSDNEKWGLIQILSDSLDDKSPVWKDVSEELGTRDASLNSFIGSQLAYRNPDNPYLANWSLENVLNKSNTDSYHSFVDLLAHSSLSKPQVNRLLGFIRENPDDNKTPYLRWAIKSQKGLTLTPDQQKLLEGSTYKYECRQTSRNGYSCGGD